MRSFSRAVTQYASLHRLGNMKRILVTVFAVLVSLDFSDADCQVALDNSPSWPAFPPVITDTAGNVFKYPDGYWGDDSRVLNFATGEEVLLSCPETFFEDSALNADNFYYAVAACSSGDVFDVTTAFYEGQFSFDRLGCQEQVEDATVDTTSSCGPSGEGDLVDIGFVTGGGGLASTITVCFDDRESMALYTRHYVPVEILARETDNERPDFKSDGYYPFSVADYYTQATQEESIAQQVGSDSLAASYVPGGEIYLARGHLAPNSDFIYASFQDATFYYINAAPQWQSFNAGNWLGIENGIRSYVESQGKDITVYTGTNGIMQLDDVNGVKVDIYLYPDDNRLQVPKYFWKMIVDERDNTGIGLVGVNNPHLTLDEIDADYRVCSAVENHVLLSEVDDIDDIYEGVVYACEYGDMRAAFEEVPDLGNLGILL